MAQPNDRKAHALIFMVRHRRLVWRFRWRLYGAETDTGGALAHRLGTQRRAKGAGSGKTQETPSPHSFRAVVIGRGLGRLIVFSRHGLGHLSAVVTHNLRTRPSNGLQRNMMTCFTFQASLLLPSPQGCSKDPLQAVNDHPIPRERFGPPIFATLAPCGDDLGLVSVKENTGRTE